MKPTLILICLISTVVLAQNRVAEINTQLSAYHGKIVVLKTPYSGKKLRYGADGSIDGHPAISTFVSSGFVYINEAKTNGKELKLKGLRCLLMYNRERRQMEAAVIGPEIAIEIKQVSPAMRDAVSAMHAVFEATNIDQRLAKYWQPEFDATQDWFEQTKEAGMKPVGVLDGNHPVYRAKVGLVNAPKIVSAPDPVYPTTERGQRLENTSHAYIIVDENGDPALVSLNHASKPEFDTASVAAISHWKFDPAIMNGKPVAVLVDVVINFR
jgi:TonB family protein